MRAEHAACGIGHIRAAVVVQFSDHLVGVVAYVVAVRLQLNAALAVGVGAQCGGIIHERANRAAAGDAHVLAQMFGRIIAAAHGGDIRHGAAKAVHGQREGKAVERLQQHILPLQLSLADGAVHRLAEVAALGVLEVRLAGKQREMHVRQRRTRQHALVDALKAVAADERLIIDGQIIHMALAVPVDAAAALAGLHEQMRLGIVAKRLVMPAAHHGFAHRFLVQNQRRQEGDFHVETVLQQLGEHLGLHRAHDLYGHMAVRRVPLHAQHGFFIFQNAQFFQQLRRRDPRRRLHTRSQHRHGMEGRRLAERIPHNAVAAARHAQAGHRHRIARLRLVHHRVV